MTRATPVLLAIVAPLAPALAAALFELTGKRLRSIIDEVDGWRLVASGVMLLVLVMATGIVSIAAAVIAGCARAHAR